jgi:hypothetical protein
MSSQHVIAVDTYGTERVTDPHTGRIVSAYKLGYTTAVTAVLLALYGANARDVSPRQASYRYIQIEGKVLVRHGHILLTLTADELARTEAITRQHHRAGVFLWREEKWWSLPDSTHTDYTEPGYRVGPNFDPTGFRPPSPTTGERNSAVTGITVGRSEREVGGQVWYWINGDTYPHRELLKAQGARWSKKRQAWYWVGEKLPDAIRALVTHKKQPPSALIRFASQFAEPITLPPMPPELAAMVEKALGEDDTHAARVVEPNSRLFGLDEKVYARHELETLDRRPIPTGTPGTVVRLYNRNAAHGWTYDVLFKDIGVCWCFERELTDYEPVRGIKIERGAVVPPGAVPPPTDTEVKLDLIASGMKPTIAETSAFDISDENDAESPPDTTDETPAPPAIRVIKPAPIPTDGALLDAVQNAIRETPTQPLVSPTAPLPNGRIARIEQSFVGELTGSITGQVFCYGFAVHDGVCVFVNMAGPRMGVEAIRAKLSKGDIVSVVPLDAPSVELTAGEGNSGMYHPYLHYLPEARFASLILVHDLAVTPNYGGKSTTFIFRTSDAQATAKLKHHITQLVNIPVFDAWSAYLCDAGQRAMLVRKCRSAGGIDLLSVDLDVDAWTRLITGGLEQGVIALPE